VKCVEDAFLSPRVVDLARTLRPGLEAAGAAEADALRRLDAASTTRAEAAKVAAKAIAQRLAPVRDELKAARPELFADDAAAPAEDAGK
jgi:hypothetical protein